MNTLRALLSILIFSLMLIACADPGTGSKNENKTEPAPQADTAKKSIPSEVSKEIGNARITIKYHAPAVRGRIIWGGLVAYDNVWVTGAHRATSLEVSKDFMVGDARIAAGKYAFFTIPSKEEWTVIINRNWDQHLADEYSEQDDVARIKVRPVMMNETVERLRYNIDQAGERLANVTMSWEKLQLPFAIRIVD
jgi:hypothetical protein